MQNVFELPARLGIREDPFRQDVPAKMSVRPCHLGAESSFNFGEGRLAGFDEFTRENVRIDDLNAVLAQELRACGFSHADTARYTQSSQTPRG